MNRTSKQKTNADGFPKAAEVIDQGAHELEAMDRAALNILYQRAHDSGRLTDPDAEFEIELLRLRPSKHESNDQVRAGLLRLMRGGGHHPLHGRADSRAPLRGSRG